MALEGRGRRHGRDRRHRRDARHVGNERTSSATPVSEHLVAGQTLNTSSSPTLRQNGASYIVSLKDYMSQPTSEWARHGRRAHAPSNANSVGEGARSSPRARTANLASLAAAPPPRRARAMTASAEGQRSMPSVRSASSPSKEACRWIGRSCDLRGGWRVAPKTK